MIHQKMSRQDKTDKVTNVLCFPCAGGNTSIFSSWERHLPPDIKITPVVLPGRERRIKESLQTNMGDLCESLLPILVEATQVPFVLLGHSFGALVCFALARLMQARGLPLPITLIVMAFPAPQTLNPSRQRHLLPDQELLAELERLGGKPDLLRSCPEIADIYIPILRADFEVIDTFVYENHPPLEIPISVFFGKEDPTAGKEDAVRWQSQTKGHFSFLEFPGNHFFLLKESTRICAEIKNCLQARNRFSY